MGQLAVVAQDDGAAVPGGEGSGYPAVDGRRWYPSPHRVRKLLGKERTGGRDRGGAGLPGRVSSPGTENTPAGGGPSPPTCVRVPRGRDVRKRTGTRRGARERRRP